MSNENWREALITALNSDPQTMAAALENAPPPMVTMAIQYLKDQAHANFQNRNFEKAAELYTQSLLGGDDPRVYVNRAECYIQLKKFKEALEDANRCIQLKPDMIDGHLRQGFALLGQTNKKSALASFQNALKLKPKDTNLKDLVDSLDKEVTETDRVLEQMLDPEKAREQAEAQAQEAPEMPAVAFDPGSFFTGHRTDADGENKMIQGLTHYFESHANLAAPRKLLALMDDPAWADFWLHAMAATRERHTVLWGAFGGVAPLEALKMGAASVTALEPHSLTGRIAGGVVQKNRLIQWRRENADKLESMSKEEQEASLKAFAEAVKVLPGGLDKFAELEQKGDCFVFTNLDHTLLGTGLVPAVKAFLAAAETDNPLVLPGSARVYAMAVQWDYQAGDLDMSGLNKFRWSLNAEAVDLERQKWFALTEPQLVAEMDVAAWESRDVLLELPVARDGELHGVVFWYELEIGGKVLSTAPDSAQKAVKPAFQYTDPLPLKAGEKLNLTLHLEESRLFFQTDPDITQKRNRVVQGWHYTMIHDAARHDAYGPAIARAVAEKQPKQVLNIGSGSGMQAMAAARAGADVLGCEISEHLTQAAEAMVAANNLSDKVTLVAKDCRKMTVPEDLEEKADMIVFDLFDCGLIGEGVIHYLEHAREHLATEDALILPAKASIRGMLIQQRRETLGDYDISLTNPYRFYPEYINVDLAKLDHVPLSEPFDVFHFDFNQAKVAEEEVEIKVPIKGEGVVGAVAFWFEVQLDEQTRISSGPFTDPHLNINQALQYLSEVQVNADMELTVMAKHTGSHVMFGLKGEGIPEENIIRTPRFDPQWLALHKQLQTNAGQMMQWIYSNPDEFKATVETAVRMAVHPAEFGVDPEVAARFASSFFMG